MNVVNTEGRLLHFFFVFPKYETDTAKISRDKELRSCVWVRVLPRLTGFQAVWELICLNIHKILRCAMPRFLISN